MDRTPFPTFDDHDELPPPTMRSPESGLRVRDHLVAVEVHHPRPAVRRAKPAVPSGIFAIAPISPATEAEPPTRHYRVA